MSDTIYLHEVTTSHGVRVSLIMDAAEVRAMADIAAAAVDGATLMATDVDDFSVVAGNAANVYKWATKAANTLDLTEELKPRRDEE